MPKNKINAGDPSRLSMLKVDKISFPKGGDCPTITVTFEYEPVCCRNEHEMVDALIAVNSLITNNKKER